MVKLRKAERALEASAPPPEQQQQQNAYGAEAYDEPAAGSADTGPSAFQQASREIDDTLHRYVIDRYIYLYISIYVT